MQYKDVMIEIEEVDAMGWSVQEIAEWVGWPQRYVEDALVAIHASDSFDPPLQQSTARVLDTVFDDVPF